MRVSHNSASYSWHESAINQANAFNMMYVFDTPQVLKKIELSALTRSSMPVAFEITAVANESNSESGGVPRYFRRITYQHVSESTGSDIMAQNNDIAYIGEEIESGSFFGIDSNGSASLDPYRYIALDNTASISAIRFSFNGFATGSHVDINQLKFYVQDGEEKIVTHSKPVYKWKNGADTTHPHVEFTRPSIHDKHRQLPLGAPHWISGTEPMDENQWYGYASASLHHRIPYLSYGLDEKTGKVLEFGTKYKGYPRVKFTRMAVEYLVSKFAYHDHTEFTHFVVHQSHRKFNYTSVYYSSKIFY